LGGDGPEQERREGERAEGAEQDAAMLGGVALVIELNGG
jgi:hypothetical protein